MVGQESPTCFPYFRIYPQVELICFEEEVLLVTPYGKVLSTLCRFTKRGLGDG